MNVKQAMEQLVKSLKEMKAEFEQKQAELQKALPSQAPAAPAAGTKTGASLHTRDKSKMKGVGPKPTMANAFNSLNKDGKVEESTTKEESGSASPMEKALPSQPPAAPGSSRPKVKDKSKMQGVGKPPTMATAFDSLNKENKMEGSSSCSPEMSASPEGSKSPTKNKMAKMIGLMKDMKMSKDNK